MFTLKPLWEHGVRTASERYLVFYKILKSIGINEERIDMIAVSHDKDTPQGYEKELNIAYVPTFIFYKQEQELGRFVEYAQGATLEEDILTIVTNQPYIPAYQ